jgi:hypothetical protein
VLAVELVFLRIGLRANAFEKQVEVMAMSASAVRKAGICVAVVLFVASLGCNTLLYGPESSFLVGLVCLLFGMSYLSWYANPFIVFSGLLLLEEKPVWAAGVAAIATGLALSALSIQEIERNEAGTMAPVIGYGAGFYLWVGCTVVLLLTACYCVAARRTGRDFAPAIRT